MLKQFNEFLVENLVQYLSTRITSGYRYRFHSDNNDNIISLVEALDKMRTSTLTYSNAELSFIEINNIKLVYVNDVTGIMNENFISNLRDAISTPEEIFKQCALLVLHKSRLDTVLNSATDLSSSQAPFNAYQVSTYIKKLISSTSSKVLFDELMKIQTRIIEYEQQSAFGYKCLYESIVNDKVDFKKLHLLNDPDIYKEHDAKRVHKRLEKNQELHDEIETTIINFPSELEERLPKYSDDFIKSKITVDNWEDVTYNQLIQEIDKNKGSSISFDNLSVTHASYQMRDESTTAAGKRVKNIIIFSDEQMISLFFKFKGNGIITEQFKILHNELFSKLATLTYMGISRTLELNIPFNLKPQYFTLQLKGKKASETFTFKILLLKKNAFYLNNIYNHYIINPKEKTILLQVNDFTLHFSEQIHNAYTPQDDEIIDINSNPTIDVENLYNSQDEVSFHITNGEDELKFLIEGKKIEEVISIPLLYNKNRLNKLFYNGEGNNAELNYNAKKAILEHREFPLIANRFTYIDFEYQFIEKGLFHKNESSSFVVGKLKYIDVSIYNSYKDLLHYFKIAKTTPSLCAWDNTVCALATQFVKDFKTYLLQIPTDTALNNNQKNIFNIGKLIEDGKEYLSPFSPLILAYILHLREASHDDSFQNISEVTLNRLNPKGLFPYLYKGNDNYAYTRLLKHDPLWLEFLPNEENEFSYVSKLTTQKIIEFTKAFEKLFEFRHDAPLIINSINNGTNQEIFKGITDYYKNAYESTPKKIIVNLYDQELGETSFDVFSDTDPYDLLKKMYNFGKNAETIIDVMRTHITYSKHTLDEVQTYAHLSFFKNNEKVKVKANKVHLQKSGLVCSGLISGESAEEKGGYYYSGFGLRGIDIEDQQHLQIAKLYNALQRSAFEAGELYDKDEVISLMISENFKNLLEHSYKNSLWTVIIDPKVTLDFFDNEKDLILIHYSDQYSSSANYDAITVTAQKELYANVVGNESIIREFNAFNGEWLIKMIAEKDERNKREKKGIIAAYKYVTALVDVAEITWVPLSVAEMLRVAGNVGLSMSKGDFSRYNEMGYNQELQGGYISDDILLVGFCKEGVVLYPVEVKSGSADMNKAIQQAKSLKSFFYDFLFKGNDIKATLLKGLFIRQIFMQVDKYELYDVFEDDYFTALHAQREGLLKGLYSLVTLENYNEGAVVAYLDQQFDSSFSIKEDILECRLPASYQEAMLEKSYQELKEEVRQGAFGTYDTYLLQNLVCSKTEDTIIQSVVQEPQNDPDLKPIVSPPNKIEEPSPSITSTEAMQIKFGVNKLNGEDIIWRPTDTTKTLNTNTGIIGTMGTGKTQFTKSLIAQMMQNIDKNINQTPIGILIFDYKGDYIKADFTEPTGAKVLEPYHLPYNPLALFGDRALLPVHTTNLFKTTLAKAFGLGTVQQSNLNRIILEAYERRGIQRADGQTWSKTPPTVQDIWDVYSNEEKVAYDSLYAALEKLISFEIFEPDPEKTTSLYDLIEGITVINLSGYDPDIQNLIVAITLDIFYTQMHIHGSSKLDGDFREITKMILVDEADNFMSQDFESLKKILKEGREFGVGTILSTQQLTHFKTSEDNYANYLQTWVIHQVSNIKANDITSIFNISNKHEAEGLMEQIRKLEKHFSIYVDGNKNMVKMRDLAFFELSKKGNK